jgi:hypothetical protein
LWKKKDNRIRQILTAAEQKYGKSSGPERVLAFSGAYSDIAAEKSIGGMQAVTSFIIGIVSFFIALVQVVGLDYYTKLFGTIP